MKIVIAMVGILLSIAIYADGRSATTDGMQNIPTSLAKVGPVFHGKVERINESSNVLTIKGKSGIVTFDVSNPILIGYGNVGDIKVGDFVGVQYVHNGIKIIKAGNEKKYVSVEPKIIKKSKPSSEIAAIKPQTNKSNSMKLQRRIRKSSEDCKSFDDVDVNKDGKLSPIELSTMIRDLTMERFKQYDKNGNGCLDRKEFTNIIRNDLDKKRE
jgi:hypothetical protein